MRYIHAQNKDARPMFLCHALLAPPTLAGWVRLLQYHWCPPQSKCNFSQLPRNLAGGTPPGGMLYKVAQ